MLKQTEKIPKWSPVLWFLESCSELSGPALVFPGQMPFYQVHLSYLLLRYKIKEEWRKRNTSLCKHTAVSAKVAPQQHKIVWHYLGKVHSVWLQGKRGHEYTCLCCFLILHWTALCFNQLTVKPLLPIITFDIVVFTFTLLWGNLSQTFSKWNSISPHTKNYPLLLITHIANILVL